MAPQARAFFDMLSSIVADPKPSGIPKIEIPDLDLPVPPAQRSAPPAPRVMSAPPVSRPASLSPSAAADLGGDFGGMEIERGMSAPPASHARPGGYPNVAIEMGPSTTGDAFDMGMEIERGGGMSPGSLPPSITTSRHPGATSGRPSSPSSGSGLDIAYGRSDLDRARRNAGPAEPGIGEKILGVAISLIVCLGAVGALAKFAHKSGRSVIGLLPRAFDATSTVQSGAIAGSLLILAIGVGFVGVKGRHRSYAMILSAAALLIGSLAMVTVTLISTEEHPTPPDGALLMPWVIPAALVLLGLGMAGKGLPLFLQGGARRVLTLVVALIGGALIFGGIELSAFASRIPF